MAAPDGTIAFLFTDIEGSARLWERDPVSMSVALRRHDKILREAVETAGGNVFKTVGDAFYIAFPSAAGALTAALEAQRALVAESWPETTPLRIRMAVHAGDAEARDDDFFGPTLNRTARLLDAGHGGQILLSRTARNEASDALPPGAGIVSLGEHRLRGLRHPEAMFALAHPDLPRDFPPLRSIRTTPNNLPAPLTSFIGRGTEVVELVDRLRHPERGRLTTLIGAGGSGKTRLALQAVAATLGDETNRDGVWFVDLAPLADPALVAATALNALGLAEEPGKVPLARFAEALRERWLVLLLDNCEHLIDAAAALAEALLRGCPRVRIVATSREPLGISGETVVRVPSLVAPDERDAPGATPEALADFDAVRLFVDRARAARPDFEVTRANAPAVASLCARLDGIPLALELAAARVKALTVEGIATRLDDRFRLLTGGSRTALPRQQTLRALVDWSYNLLGEEERTALDRFSVFSGGWTLEAAEAVVGFDPLEPWQVLDALGALVDKSLVVHDAEAGRYRMLETIRAYADERLASRPEEGEIARDRQARFVLDIYEKLGNAWFNTADAGTLPPLEADLDNLRAAVERLLRTDLDGAARLMNLAAPVWYARGRTAEALVLYERALATYPDIARLQKARVLVIGGIIARLAGQTGRAIEFLERALEERRRAGEAREIVNALFNLGDLLNRAGEPARAKTYLSEALDLAVTLPPPNQRNSVSMNLAQSLALLGDRSTARMMLEGLEQGALARKLHANAGEIRMFLGWIALRDGELERATPAFRNALDSAIRAGNHITLVDGLFGAVASTHAQSRMADAARLAGLHDRVHRDGGTLIAPVFRNEHAARIEEIRAKLGEAAFDAAYAEGERLSPEDALSLLDWSL